MEEINYIFNTAVLKKGDILLINTYNERLQKLMHSQYDHAALFAGDAHIMESDGGGVAMNHVFSYGFKGPNDAIVLRSFSDSELIREGVVFCARCSMGMEFGSDEAKRVPRYEATDQPDESNRMFCSRLVAVSYQKMGIQLVANPNYCSPASFLTSDKLFKVENALIVANDDVKKIVSIYEKMRKDAANVEILVDLFQRMNVFYDYDIQGIDQLIQAALRYPEKDEEAIAVLQETDYYKKRFDGRNLYCLNDKEAFNIKYDTLERRIWFLLNQDAHLEKTYIPDVSANARTFSLLSSIYPKSKVVAFFRDFFVEQGNELIDYQIWVRKLLVEIIENDSDEFKRITSDKSPV